MEEVILEGEDSPPNAWAYPGDPKMSCFRCGEPGHWANQCTGGAGDRPIPEGMADQFDPGDFPTLDQVFANFVFVHLYVCRRAKWPAVC